MKNKNLIIAGASLAGATTIAGLIMMKTRRTIPRGVHGVDNFDAELYLGKWYEIARMPMRFENGLTEVSAHYSLSYDGTIKVVNRGYDPRKGEWKQAEGKAKFVRSHDMGELKVSFFGPFYAGYNVVRIDKDYRYALVFGRNLDYMWLLSRDKEMPKKTISEYLKTAARAGYDLEKLIWTEQK